MKALRKISFAVLAVCSLFFCMTFVSFAADGTLQFSDPTTTNGAEVTVDVKMSTGGAAIGDGNVNLKYDAGKLEFVSGTNATGGNGTVALAASGTGTETELSYSIVFKALAEGTTTVEVTDYKAFLYSDESLNLTTGNSTVTIGAGSGVTADTSSAATSTGDSSTVTVNGTNYTIDEGFSDSSIPSGFVKSTATHNGAQKQCALQETSGLYMFYLKDGNGDVHMALYDADTEEFSFTEQVDLSSDVYILLSNRGDGKGLPSEFQETTLTVNGNQFPTWQDTSATDFYLMYALSSNGNEDYYRYDQSEGTYQRYKIPEDSSSDKKALSGILGKIQNFVDGKFLLAMVAVAAVFVVLFILLIVLLVKLFHRNHELDNLYDSDYNLDSQGKAGIHSKTNKNGYDEDDEYYEDDEYDEDEYYEDDEYDEDDEYYEDDEYDDDDEYYEDDGYDDDDEYYEDDEYDEYYEECDKRKGDTTGYNIDFIDLE